MNNIQFVLKFVFTFILLSILTTNAQTSEFRKIENNAFREGEKLTFDVKYGFVTAGVAVMSIPRIRKISGRNAYHVNFEVNSVPNFDWVFKVRDKYESYIDVEGIFPWRFEQHIREGNYSRDFSAFFDHRKGRAKTSEGEYPIPKNVHDIISAFYFARTIDYSKMKVGDKVELQNFYKDKVHQLDVKYLGKERITVPAGTFDCVIVEPLVLEGGLFKSEGNIVIWLSDDNLKVPVKVKTKVVIGSIDAELTAFEGLAGKFSAKVK
ncbi:MAG TPA: DUF3108 domain-containing protein [Ignavibacteriaceae bacterium]|nr:DUF3108 domain-containing protein [Ignavibacteriaceae bacterium]